MMPLSFYCYIIVPNLILALLLWLTRGAKGFVMPYTLGGLIVICGFQFFISVMWAKSMVAYKPIAWLWGLSLVSGCIGMLIGIFLRDRRWKKRQREQNELPLSAETKEHPH